MTSQSALVIAAHGRHYLLAFDDHSECVAVSRGRDQDFAAGDHVIANRTSATTGVIEKRATRRNVLYRSDRFKRKTLAANVDQVAYVIAPDPPFSDELLLRVQLAADFEGIRFALVANKSDLTEAYCRLAPRLELLRELQVPLFEVSAKSSDHSGLDPLREWLTGQVTVLAGQSGMGKSTLLNRLVPGAGMQTQAISERLQSGRHTTTYARVFQCAELTGESQTSIIDTPGFQQFGLGHLSESQLRYGALEFKPGEHRCRFNNCQHLGEPGCAVALRVQRGQIDASRYSHYRRIVEEALAANRKQ